MHAYLRLAVRATITPRRYHGHAPALSTSLTRDVRNEIKAAVDPMRKANAESRRQIAELKRHLAALQRDLKSASKSRPAAVEARDGREAPVRFSAKGLRSLRARFGLSAAGW